MMLKTDMHSNIFPSWQSVNNTCWMKSQMKELETYVSKATNNLKFLAKNSWEPGVSETHPITSCTDSSKKNGEGNMQLPGLSFKPSGRRAETWEQAYLTDRNSTFPRKRILLHQVAGVWKFKLLYDIQAPPSILVTQKPIHCMTLACAVYHQTKKKWLKHGYQITHRIGHDQHQKKFDSSVLVE